MAVDLTNLVRTELLQLLNATPLGAVLTRTRLQRHMDAGGLRFGDGSRIHLARYARWLIGELDQPKPVRLDYDEAKRRESERGRAATRAAQDIYPIPDVVNYERRKRCAGSFRQFCETYFAVTFNLEWSDDHLRVIACMERAVLDGGLLAFAMPRGTGKTSLARCAALWAVFYGYRPFVCLIGATGDLATGLLRPIRLAILEDPLLLADFPEAVYPLRCLENSSKRQLMQHIGGCFTHVHWGHDMLVFPTVADEHMPRTLRERGDEVASSSGSIITTTSLDANLRGQHHARTDGVVIRPSLVLLDDPQTRQSAASPTQTRRRMELLNGDVLGLAGPGVQIAAMLACTKIYDADLADRLLQDDPPSAWASECTKLVNAFPVNEKLWDEYANLYLAKHHAKATEFYRENQEAMDEGANVAWPARYDRKKEVSAIQNAMNLKLTVGPEAFASEYQNEPVMMQMDDHALTVEQVCEKINGFPRGEIPPSCTKLSMFVDVHDRLLYWCACAWEENFTGYVVDYGVFPEQKRREFTMATANRTLGRAAPGTGIDGAIQAGLELLVTTQLARDWPRGEGLMKVEKLLVDMGYKSGIVADVKRRAGGSVMMLAKGVGIRAGRKPISEYTEHKGERIGHHWFEPATKRRGQFQHVLVDVNHWKSFVHGGLATAVGERGCISLFGREANEHEQFAEHVARSETWVEVTSLGRVVHEWSQRPTRPDNHWFDCLVGCAAAASMMGCAVPGMAGAPTRRRRVTMRELAARASTRTSQRHAKQATA